MSRIIIQRRFLRFGLPMLTFAGTLGALEYARSRFQHSRLFAPERYPEGEWKPKGLGLKAHDCWFPSEGGLQLHGWWIPRKDAVATLLYCHGNSGSIGLGVRVLRHFSDLPVNLFAFDYRGYGRSEGRPSEVGLFQDARAAYRHLVDSLEQDARRIVLFGHSLGGAVAIDSACRLDVAGLIVQASFTDVRGMARSLFPRLPMHWIARNQFRSIDKIPQVSAPKLFVHGRRDETVPFEMGRQLFEAAQGEKEFFPVERGGHNDLHLRGGLEYRRTLGSFFDRCTQPSSADQR